MILLRRHCTFRFSLRTLALVALGVGLWLGVGCQSDDGDLNNHHGAARAQIEYTDYMRAAVEIWSFSGAVLVARGDEILLREGYGLANRDSRTANEPGTRFLIGSTTKIFTAIAILQQVEAGEIDLHAPMTNYLPDYPAPPGSRITVHHLLSHTSGLSDVLRNPTFVQNITEPIAPEEIVALFQDEPLAFEPGAAYAYTNSNYILLALILEAVTGEAWENYIEHHICAPCGMSATRVYHDYYAEARGAIDSGEFAQGYIPDPTGELRAGPEVHLSRGYGAGALASTVDDLYHLDRALARHELLSEETTRSMLTSHGDAYGYGWIVDRLGDHLVTAHGGGVPGQVSIFQRWIDDSICVVVLCNQGTVPVHQVANGLAAIAMGEPCELPVHRTPILLPQEALEEYVGSYRMANGVQREITLDGGQLRARRGEGTGYLVLPEALDRFYYAHDPLTRLTFLRDADGRVKAQVVQQAFDADTAQRIPTRHRGRDGALRRGEHGGE